MMNLANIWPHLSMAEMLVSAAIVGLIVGSFLNVVIWRLPQMLTNTWWHDLQLGIQDAASYLPEAATDLENVRKHIALHQAQQSTISLWKPGSNCPICHHRVAAWDNIPLISYALLKGRCRNCQTKISLQYPAVEALTGACAMLAAYNWGLSLEAFAAFVFYSYLITLAYIDARTFLLPDNLTLPLIWLGLLFNTGDYFSALSDAVIGAAAGYSILRVIYWLFKRFTGKEGFGFGDFKLLAAIGAWLGWQALMPTLMLASIVAVAVRIFFVLLTKRTRQDPIPFGPYLVSGAFFTQFDLFRGLF